MKRVMRQISLFLLAIAAPCFLHGQGRIVLNGGRVNIANGAVVVVANSGNNAITRTSSGGHFISEGADNRIRWNIGTSTGNYVIPWATASGNYMPLSFSPSAATGVNGHFYFATYQTPAQNSLNLPPGVSQFNAAIETDASLVAVDRFWKIDAQSYTANPAMANLTFSYPEEEYASPNKTTIENKLTARRWNPALSSWQDFVTGGVVNANANTVVVASLPAAQLQAWWSLQYPGAAYHWVSTATSNYSIPANWSATAGGTGGGMGVPGAGDAVFFDDIRDGSCNINTTVDVGSWTVGTGYAGTISQSTNAMTIDGNATFSSGSFAGGAAAMTFNGNLTISGATFTAPSSTLDLKNNFTLTSGTFNHNSGTVRFSGTNGTQTITAPSATFYHIDVTNTAGSPGLIFESNNQLAGVLTLATNVVVDPDGAADNRVLTLLSTSDSPTADAAIGILPNGALVNGRVTVQRYMSIEGANGGRIYRYIASPVNAATVADIQSEIPITGSFTGTSKCTGCNTTQSMFEYNEPVTTDLNKNGVANYDDGYIDFPQSTNAETLVPGRGYAMFVRGNVITTARWDVRGRINAGNSTPVTLPVSYTASGAVNDDGWNLVGNPYPSTIDWNAVDGWTKTNINNAIYTRDNSVTSGQFATWNGVTGTNGGSRYIATGQAFWVKANGTAPMLRVNENVKTPGTQATFFRDEAPQNLLRITLSQGAIKDEAVVHLRNDATNDFDAQADALKMLNSTFNLSTQIGNTVKMAINSLDQSLCAHTIALLVEYANAGSYNLSFEGLESFKHGATVTLTDAFTNTTVNISEASNYTFSITTDALSYSSTRFSLNIARQAAPTDFQASAQTICQGNDASIKLDNTSQMNVYELLINGQPATTQAGVDGNMLLTIPASQLQSGSNAVTVRATPSGVCGTTVSKVLSVTVDPRASVQSASATPICREGQATVSATGASEGQAYRWYATPTNNVVLSTESSFTTPVLAKNTTYFVAIANATGCEGERIPVMVEVTHYDDPAIISSGDSLYVTYPGPKQWFLDGVALQNDTLSIIKPQQSGVYSVQVAVGTCVASALTNYKKPELVTGGIPESTTATLQVYPNPVRGYLYIESHDTAIKQVNVQNVSGQMVGAVKLPQGTGKIDMSPFAAGLYFIQIETATGTSEIKVIKE